MKTSMWVSLMVILATVLIVLGIIWYFRSGQDAAKAANLRTDYGTAASGTELEFNHKVTPAYTPTVCSVKDLEDAQVVSIKNFKEDKRSGRCKMENNKVYQIAPFGVSLEGLSVSIDNIRHFVVDDYDLWMYDEFGKEVVGINYTNGTMKVGGLPVEGNFNEIDKKNLKTFTMKDKMLYLNNVPVTVFHSAPNVKYVKYSCLNTQTNLIVIY